MAANASSSTTDRREGYDFAHPLPVWLLVTVFLVLTALTVLTVLQANLDLGSIDIVLALLIATVKATLVMAIFMHLAYDKPFNLIIFAASFVFVALFMSLTLMDARHNSELLEPVIDPAPALIEATAAADEATADGAAAAGTDGAAAAAETAADDAQTDGN